MVNHTSGIICIGMTGERLEQLQLPQMVVRNTEAHQTAFTVSVDYRHGTHTGISASDRAATLRALVDQASRPEDFNRPGHVFPLRAKPGGVLERPGHTETSVDLARLAGLAPAGVMCEVVNQDGSMARAPTLRKFASVHKLPFITIAELIAYRRANRC
jgi:3,4-dihydroxy 2-butanone 4-phosphate synthase/GTP cyclohydrolase II